MILEGDSLEVLKTLEVDSIDFVCTDPPYGYSFMGKDWDRAVPSVDIWRECLRVLKPGAFMCVMSAPRSDVQNAMISRLMEAGFRLDFTPIYWTYASGFPKAGNIGKLVDKRMGAIPEIIGEKPWTTSDKRGGQYANGGDDRERIQPMVTTPGSPEGQALDGSYAGFQPKPAVEVIIVAMKPLSEKTYVDQALKNGKGISWLDDGRIPTDTNLQREIHTVGFQKNGKSYDYGEPTLQGSTSGRFPANLLVSDDVLNDGVHRHAAGNKKPMPKKEHDDTSHGKYLTDRGYSGTHNPDFYGDSGSYSRYFDLDKWSQTLPFLIVPKASKGEKNRGLEHIEPAEGSHRQNNSIWKIDARHPDGGYMTAPQSKQHNHHPTVKPLKLMSYLITLFSRPGDTVLDPFVGSGTTVVAAKQLDREGIGIEREAEYAEIARARLAHVSLQLPTEPVTQPPVTMDEVLEETPAKPVQLRLI